MPIALKPPYLLFLGAVASVTDAKTAMGIAYWRRELCCGQLQLPGCKADKELPDMDLAGPWLLGDSNHWDMVEGQARTGLHCTDPILDGVGGLVAALESAFG